jgi:hypothetical protein
MVKTIAAIPQFQFASNEERLEAAKPLLSELRKKYMMPQAQLISLRDEFYIVVQGYSLARVRQIHCAAMGFHPRNRGGIGLTPSECHAKLALFHKSGFSGFECERASSAQRSPKAIGDEHEASNAKIASQSHGQLPPIVTRSLESFSLTCNHTFGALRCAYYGVESTDESISENGVVSTSKLQERSPQLGDAIANGIPVLEIVWEVERDWPDLIDLVIEADNVPMQVAAADPPATFFLKAHAIANAELGRDCEVDAIWSLVEAKLARAVARDFDAKPYVDFVRKWSGSAGNPWVLLDFDRHSKSLKVLRPLPSHVIQKLADIDLGPLCGALWRLACLKAVEAAPAKYILGSDNVFITPKDISTMSGSNLAFVLQADQYMRDATQMITEIGEQSETPNSASNRIHLCHSARDAMDIAMVSHILAKSSDKYKSLFDIASEFYASIQKVVDPNHLPSMPKAWEKQKPKAKANAAAKLDGGGQKRAFQEIAEDGATKSQVVATLAERGAEVGTATVRKSDSVVYKITAVTNNLVKLKNETEVITVPVRTWYAEYSVKKVVKEVVMAEWDFELTNHISFTTEVAVGRMRCVLYDMHKASVDMFKSVVLVVNPPSHRAVRVTLPIKKGCLQLAPLTSAVGCTKGAPKEKIPSGNLELGPGFQHPKTGETCHLYANGKIQTKDEPAAVSGRVVREVQPEFLVPFWLVGVTDNAKIANVKLQLVASVDGSVKVPCFVNTKQLKEGDVLRAYVAPNAPRFAAYASLKDNV